MATSFPYLKIARDYGVPYADVLRFVDAIEQAPNTDPVWEWWMAAAWMAGIAEHERRAAVRAEPKTVQWSASADYTSWKPDPSAGSMKVEP